MSEPKRRGRPTNRTPEVIERVIEGLSAGTPLAVLCREEGMPAERTVRDWASKDEELAADIARARDTGYDAIANRLRQTARGQGESTDDVQRDKLIIDTDLKLLAKWDYKRYGDKVQHAGDGGGALKVVIERYGNDPAAE